MKIQSFTRYLAEDSVAYEKLQSKKFRKITYNESEKAIMKNTSKAAIAGVNLYFEENPEDDDAYFKKFSEIKNKRFAGSFGEQDFEVFYSFSGSIRGNRKYGNANWSARFLYEFLSVSFNGGERFIDTYLNRVFPHRPVYNLLDDLVNDTQDAIRNKWNNGNLKGGQWSSFYRFQEAEMDKLTNQIKTFSYKIREDIIQCLSNGMIPLNFSLASSTLKKRQSLGLGDQPFYATAWLINQIEINIVLGNSDEAQLYYSDSYKGA